EGTLQIVLAASFAVPDRDTVPPPELAANAPVAFFAQPVEVALGVTIGVDLDPARADGIHRLLGEAGRAVVVAHADEPLVREVRLDRGLAAVRVIETDEVRVDPVEQVECFEVLDNSFSHDEPI